MEEHGHQALLEGLLGHELYLLLELPLYLLVERFMGLFVYMRCLTSSGKPLKVSTSVPRHQRRIGALCLNKLNWLRTSARCSYTALGSLRYGYGAFDHY